MAILRRGGRGTLAGTGRSAALFGEVSSLSLEELGTEVALATGGAALACLAVLELEVGGKGDLMVSGPTEGLSATGLG